MPNKYSSIEIDGGPMVALAREALGEDAVGLAERAGASYERRICELLAQIGSKKTGRAVLRAIQLQTVDGYGLRIEPYPIKQPDRTPNADAGPEPRIGKRRAGREGRRRDSAVRFTPAHWGKADPALQRLGRAGSTYGHGPGNEPDEMLLHEMVHGLRIMSGVAAGPYSRRAVPGQAQYDTMEEFYAILVANIYRSEWRRPGLRWDHSRFFISHDITDEAFLKTERNRRHLRQLRRQNRSLSDGLSDVDARSTRPARSGTASRAALDRGDGLGRALSGPVARAGVGARSAASLPAACGAVSSGLTPSPDFSRFPTNTRGNIPVKRLPIPV